MPRPKRCRRICSYPQFWSFGPEGSKETDVVLLKLDELETVRLIDHQKKTQEECALEMGVSRATVTSIYESARFKISDALLNGKRIHITGGAYQIDSIPDSAKINEIGVNMVRIAVTYDNGMVGQHFGRTEQFKVYDIDVDKREVTGSQVVDTNGEGHGALAGFLRAAEVQILICGGIGMGARAGLSQVGIEILPGVSGNADEVVKAFLGGTLEYDPNTECHHHDHEEGHQCGHGEGHECGHGHGEGHSCCH
ncbi:MAG: DUF134 domain-containing protein [Sphaerochaetaceae bacterium]|nr:DUF134 domain-containing protein [Sphaerochaetaceae bacterium]